MSLCMSGLTDKLSNSDAGCYVNVKFKFINHIMFADYVCLCLMSVTIILLQLIFY